MPYRAVAPQTERVLASHPWRGNVRELENTIHRAVLLASGAEIGPEAIRLPDGTHVGQGTAHDMPGPVKVAVENAAAVTRGLVGRTVADVERDLILDTLGHCLGNRTHAANILGISIRTLRNKLREYSQSGLAVPCPAASRGWRGENSIPLSSPASARRRRARGKGTQVDRPVRLFPPGFPSPRIARAMLGRE